MNEKTYTTIGTAMLTLTELIIAFVLLSVKSMTIAEAAAEGSRQDAAPVRDVKGLSYAECARGYTACEMLILAGIAEWDNKTRSRIRITEAGAGYSREITRQYKRYYCKYDAVESPDVAACAMAEPAATPEPSEGSGAPQTTFQVGALVRYKRHASRTMVNGEARAPKRRGIIMAIDKMGKQHARVVHVNWGAYGTFWDRVRNLEVVNASR